jgi:hypothetical protein
VKPRPSQRLDLPLSIFDEEFGLWCELVLSVWRCDPNLWLEFASIIQFFDFANEAVDKLILSASEN